jgi:hypothetical protein
MAIAPLALIARSSGVCSSSRNGSSKLPVVGGVCGCMGKRDWWSRLSRVRVVLGVVVGGLGLVGWLAPAAGAFAFRSAPGSPYSSAVDAGPPISAVVGDFNRDGLPDFAVVRAPPCTCGHPFPPTTSVWLADGSGGFRDAGHIAGASMAVGDFNGDGKLDLVGINSGVYPIFAITLSVLLGNGDGTFTPAPGSPIALDAYSVQVVVGDFNRDGRPDLAVLCTNDTVHVLLGNGDGTFTPARGSPIALGAGTHGALVVADFTGDGKLDLAVTDQTQGTVSILLGNGDGTFTPAPGSPIAVGGMPSELAVGDFNRDGKPDLAVNNAPAGGLTVLLGRGDGTFSPAPGSPTVLSDQLLSGLAVADFNDDGKPDIAVGSFAGLDLLLGDGSGGFRPAQGSPFAEGQGLLASGTFDGRTGVVVSGSEVDVSVLLAPLPSDPPMAALVVSPQRVTTGQRIALDASGSSDPLDRKIVDYRWDLGSGRFNHNTGTNPKLTATFRSAGTFRVRVRVTNAAGETAIATVKLSVHPPTRITLVAGYVQVCGGPAPGGCAERAIRICEPAGGCVISDRVAAVNVVGRVVTVQKLNHGRFRLRLTPGRYTIELLGDAKHVHGRVLQRRKVTARAHHTATVRFFFALP